MPLEGADDEGRMRTLSCSKCGRNQASGKFCLDCGGPIIEKVTSGIDFKPITTIPATR